MPSRIPLPSSRLVNNAPAAMPSLAAAPRITAPQCASVARIPIATARSTRPVNSASVAHKHPTVQPSTTIASMASSFAAMSISKPINQAIAPPSAPKPTSSLPGVDAHCSKLASDRIQARRQRVLANLDAPKKRPTAPAPIRKSSSVPSRATSPPVSILQSSSIPSRAVPQTIITPVSILKSSSKPTRVIPPPPANAPASTLVSSWMPSPWRIPRGRMPYCEGRPGVVDCNGDRPETEYRPNHYLGIKCKCHPTDETIPTKIWIGPRRWETTPAEADVDPTRDRTVRFADNLVEWTREFRPWYTKTWDPPEQSKDEATEEDDDADILAMEN